MAGIWGKRSIEFFRHTGTPLLPVCAYWDTPSQYVHTGTPFQYVRKLDVLTLQDVRNTHIALHALSSTYIYFLLTHLNCIQVHSNTHTHISSTLQVLSKYPPIHSNNLKYTQMLSITQKTLRKHSKTLNILKIRSSTLK